MYSLSQEINNILTVSLASSVSISAGRNTIDELPRPVYKKSFLNGLDYAENGHSFQKKHEKILRNLDSIIRHDLDFLGLKMFFFPSCCIHDSNFPAC